MHHVISCPSLCISCPSLQVVLLIYDKQLQQGIHAVVYLHITLTNDDWLWLWLCILTYAHDDYTNAQLSRYNNDLHGWWQHGGLDCDDLC